MLGNRFRCHGKVTTQCPRVLCSCTVVHDGSRSGEVGGALLMAEQSRIVARYTAPPTDVDNKFRCSVKVLNC